MVKMLELPLRVEDYRPTDIGRYTPLIPLKLWSVAEELSEIILEQDRALNLVFSQFQGHDSPIEKLLAALNEFYRSVDDLLFYRMSEGRLSKLFLSYEAALETFILSGQCSLKLAKELNSLKAEALLSFEEILTAVRAYGAPGSWVFSHCTQLFSKLSQEELKHVDYFSLDLFMRGMFDNGPALDEKQKQYFLDYLHLRDALIEAPLEANLFAYVEAARKLEASCDEKDFSALEAFEDNFWVNRTWVRETEVVS